jgi:hypothetical protein
MNRGSRVLRIGTVAVAVLLTAICATTPAGATAQLQHHNLTARGVFHYSTPLGGEHTITNPVIGLCYHTHDAISGSNQTNAIAWAFLDGSCSVYGTAVNPGDSVDRITYFSVRFRQIGHQP